MAWKYEALGASKIFRARRARKRCRKTLSSINWNIRTFLHLRPLYSEVYFEQEAQDSCCCVLYFLTCNLDIKVTWLRQTKVPRMDHSLFIYPYLINWMEYFFLVSNKWSFDSQKILPQKCCWSLWWPFPLIQSNYHPQQVISHRFKIMRSAVMCLPSPL